MIDTSSVISEQDLVFRLKKRAEIRRQIATRKSVLEGKPDRISDLLEEAATEIQMLRKKIDDCNRPRSVPVELSSANWVEP